MQITYDLRGDEVRVSVDFPAADVLAREDGTVSLTMTDIDWRRAARTVLKECNAIELKLSPETVVQRVRVALADAVKRAADAEQRGVCQLRAASSVLHRLGDLVQGGTVTAFEVKWSKHDDPDIVTVAYTVSVPAPEREVVLELGKGIIEEHVRG